MFYAGDAVWVINFAGTPKWVSGVLEDKLGPVTFTVRLPDGRIWRRHMDHIRACIPMEESNHAPMVAVPLPPPDNYMSTLPTVSKDATLIPAGPATEPKKVNSVPGALETVPNEPQLRRSSRVVKPPDKLTL